MDNWKKTSLFTVLVLMLGLIGIFYLFNLSITYPSSDIEFSPGLEVSGEAQEYSAEKPKNIILFIADGMGFSHLSLALLAHQSEHEPSVWNKFEVKGWQDARSYYGPLTDSEASATAMATGTSTNFGHVGIDKNQKPLQTLFELASDEHYTTAIVTDSYIWDGTPAAFVAHTRNEDDARDILKQIAGSELDLLFGELEDLGERDVPEKEESLNILRTRFQLLDRSLEIPSGENLSKPIAAIFDEDEVQDLSSTPNLPQLTQVGLKYLMLQGKPFVLLVECEEMDPASHENDSERVLKGLESIQETLALVLDFSRKQGETLVVFTADHETGGMAVVADFDHYPKMQIKWSSKDHTAAVVPLFADGPGAEYFDDIHRNWEIGERLKKMVRKDTTQAKNDVEN